MMAPKAAIERSYTLALWPSAPVQVTDIGGTDLCFYGGSARPGPRQAMCNANSRLGSHTEPQINLEDHYVGDSPAGEASNCTQKSMGYMAQCDSDQESVSASGLT